MHTKRFNTFLKRWVQFCVGAIPRIPYFRILKILKLRILRVFLCVSKRKRGGAIERDNVTYLLIH